MFIFLSHSDGFGINTDIFETNILNLTVVIGVLVYYGRIVLADIVNNHKSVVLKSLQEAQNKLKEAEASLLAARNNFQIAKEKAEDIRNQSILLSSQTKKSLLLEVEDDIKRLQSSGLSVIRLEEEKSVSEMCQTLMNLALKRSAETLSKRLTGGLHKKIVSQNTDKLSLKALVNK